MHIRLHALTLLALSFAQPQSAHADAPAPHCQMTPVARLPVIISDQRATIPVSINGQSTRMMIDTGAIYNTMSKAMAAQFNLATVPMPSTIEFYGVGGRFKAERTKVHDFSMAGAKLPDEEFLVGGSDMGQAVLGINLWGASDSEFDFAKGVANLFKENNCGKASLAYWAGDLSVGTAKLQNSKAEHIYVQVYVNGHEMWALLDTGYHATMISRAAAEKFGIEARVSKMVKSATQSGFGMGSVRSWISHAKLISVGGEEIHNTPIRVTDDSSDDMVLGIDFLMAHHVIISPGQHRMYLTYNGGAIFSATSDDEIGHRNTVARDIRTGESAADPTTADGYASRGSGRMARKDFKGAIADFSSGISLAPDRAELLSLRAKAYHADGHKDLAEKDIDAALAKTPADTDLLIWRARIRLRKHEITGAMHDTDAAAAAVPKGSLDALSVVTLYERLGKAALGLPLLDAAIDLHHNDSEYLGLLARRCWIRALADTQLDGALKDCTTAINRYATSATRGTRAFVQFRRKAYAAAIDDANAAIANHPKFATPLFVRGLVRLQMGDSAAARTDFAAARAVSPTIDQRFVDYGLTAPDAPAAPAQPTAPGGDDESDQ